MPVSCCEIKKEEVKREFGWIDGWLDQQLSSRVCLVSPQHSPSEEEGEGGYSSEAPHKGTDYISAISKE